MKRSVVVPSHQHKTFDIKPLGECRACDDFHERQGLTSEDVEAAMLREPPGGMLRLLRMLRDLNPERHAQYLEWIAEGVTLADAVDEAMGEWPSERKEQ
ncbi:hypothetical protein GCM10022239_03590 [Leifsonia bigeumensis]|uniref:Uncharacterized protein n=1 Tax=Leifsonella bigeumensis TaxID=433643 RepID=A0ABP7F5W2_9MICO